MKNSAGSADVARSSARRPCGLRRNAAGKLSGPVEDVIAWAWREELPKAPKIEGGPLLPASGWRDVARYGEYLSLVELYGVNGWGCVPDFSAERFPCADAIAIGEAVASLDATVIEMPEDWSPAPELDRFGGLGAKAVSEAWRKMTRDEGGATVLRVKPSQLVIRNAVLGADLDGMELDDVERKVESHQDGRAKWFVRRDVWTIVGTNPDGSDRLQLQSIETPGTNRHGRPMPGAYQKPYLDPDPVNIVIARVEHEIWFSALMMIHEELAGRLEHVEMLPPVVPVAPWLPPRDSVRVLPDLAGLAAQARREREERMEALNARFPRWFRQMQREASGRRKAAS